MEGAIDEVVNVEGAFEQYIELLCLRNGLGIVREEAKQAKLSFPPAEKTALRTPAEAKSQVSGEEHEMELEDAKTTNNKAL